MHPRTAHAAGMNLAAALRALTVATLLGTGLVAGVCFAFSSFVMPGLARLAPAQGAAAMNAINGAAVTPLFMVVLFGAAVGALALAVAAPFSWADPAARLRLAAALCYLAGVIAVTAICNVPRNVALAAPGTDAAAAWPRYLASWTAWNHVRVGSALAAALLLALSLRGRAA